jgi:hypothetical protein
MGYQLAKLSLLFVSGLSQTPAGPVLLRNEELVNILPFTLNTAIVRFFFFLPSVYLSK